MSTLQFYPLKKHSSVPFTFTARVEPSKLSGAAGTSHRKLEFRSTGIIQSGETTVYRGVLIGLGTQEIQAICKLAVNPDRDLRDGFQNEACAYQDTLRDMQGHYIPEFYGLYDGIVRRDDAVCLIVEDCGRSIGMFSRMSDEWLVKAVEILMAIHDRGLRHNDFCPQNIVVDDVENPSYIKVIDFQYCSPHKCERKTDLHAFDFPPTISDFGCRELHAAAKRSGVWTPPNFRACGRFMHILAFDTPEDLLKRIPQYEERSKTYGQALRWAKADIRVWQDRWRHRADYIDGDDVWALKPVM